MHRNTRNVTSIPAALFVWAASNTVFSSFFLSPRFNSIAVDIFLYCVAGSTTNNLTSHVKNHVPLAAFLQSHLQPQIRVL